MEWERNAEQSEGLREVQRIQADMLRSFADICAKERLAYYIIGGTLLGAVRHKGFIPWDDDIDVGMPRPDYERFLDIAGKYSDDTYRIVTHRNDSRHLHYFSRLTNSKRKLYVGSMREGKVEDAWIDIFPLDGMPNNSVARRLHAMRLLYRRAMYQLAHFECVNVVKNNRPWHERLIIRVGQTLSSEKYLSKDGQFEAMDRALKSCPYESSDYLIDMMGGYKMKELFPKAVFGAGREYEFEGMQFIGPVDYDTYLTQLYGDYMTPPPMHERNVHATMVIQEADDIGRIGGGYLPLIGRVFRSAPQLFSLEGRAAA